ncbi:glyoxalase superfamily protein [Halarcobacter anaerophilus]|uniref:Glyoxalase-related protein domain-containing protein n=1 Tax=Halarcobacter anaerophilus TaxID=877500 RepID=A0A4Q0XYX6_9BACT|nr:glyoxalase superfamily protein [Halarcobacter anaerophilus]QDF29935.1 hypothetical protein AANAER_2479 [Halarcobacter anaerophilus]RXJ62897.1 hypothetical protein CRV06_08665 [Halarcobacter anaerophilus]
MPTTLHTNVSNIKSVAKNLAKNLEKMDFKLSHSASLNLAAKSLGYENYNTYKALENSKSSTFGFLNSMSLEDLDKEHEEKYPSIDYNFVYVESIKNFDILIHMELAAGEENYYILVRMKKNLTKRVLFSPTYNTCSFFVYPDVKKATSDYHIEFNINSMTDFLDTLSHISWKGWYNTDIHIDFVQLMHSVIINKTFLRNYSNKYTQEDLEKIYKKNKEEN